MPETSKSPCLTFLTFELNQVKGLWENEKKAMIPCRTTGDVLIAYNVGGSTIHVVFYRWITDTSTTVTIPPNPTPVACAKTGHFEPSGGMAVEPPNEQGALNPTEITNYLKDTVNPTPSKFAAGSFGEASLKVFVDTCIEEELKLEKALFQLRTRHRIALLHYAPCRQTLEGEPLEIFPFLGATRLSEPLLRIYRLSAAGLRLTDSAPGRQLRDLWAQVRRRQRQRPRRTQQAGSRRLDDPAAQRSRHAGAARNHDRERRLVRVHERPARLLPRARGRPERLDL